MGCVIRWCYDCGLQSCVDRVLIGVSLGEEQSWQYVPLSTANLSAISPRARRLCQESSAYCGPLRASFLFLGLATAAMLMLSVANDNDVLTGNVGESGGMMGWLIRCVDRTLSGGGGVTCHPSMFLRQLVPDVTTCLF